MRTLTKDARGFVDGIVDYLSHEGKPSVVGRVTTLFGKVTRQAKKEKTARVETSSTPSVSQKERLEAALARFIGHPVEVEYTINPGLLAGISIQIADWIVDTSLRGQLQAMIASFDEEIG